MLISFAGLHDVVGMVVLAHYYGRNHIGQIYGCVSGLWTVATGASPLLLELGHSYLQYSYCFGPQAVLMLVLAVGLSCAPVPVQ